VLGEARLHWRAVRAQGPAQNLHEGDAPEAGAGRDSGPDYDARMAPDDAGETAGRQRTAGRSGARPAQEATLALRGVGPVAQQLAGLRTLAASDPRRAQEHAWRWIAEFGRRHDAGSLEALFELGGVPRRLEGAADGMLVTTLLNPLVERAAFQFVSGPEPGKVRPRIPVLAIDYRPITTNPRIIIRQIRDELVEVVPKTYLGRILFRVPRGPFINVGYFALRQPAGER
jgi:hypothetical protein